MKLLRPVVPFVLMLVCGFPAHGDRITLKNGDRLTGPIVKSDGKSLTIKSDLAGPVTVPWDAVETISSTAPLNLTLKDGQVLLGPVTTADGKLEVATQTAGTVTTPKGDVQGIRSKEEQAAYEAELDRLRNPRLLDLWSGFVDTGLSAARGNAKTTAFNLTMNAARTTKRDKISAYFTSLYATNATNGPPMTTANAERGGVGYSLNISDRAYGFGSVDLEFDEFQKLDLRFAPGGGLGYHAVKSERTTLDLFGGGALNKEFFSTGLKRTSGEILAGQEVTYKLSTVTSLHEKLVFYPNLTETGQYRINFDASAVTALKKWLAWQLSISNRYLSNPVFGAKTDDLLLTTGLRVTFAR